MKTLIIDNHDSFTFNLVHLIAEINQEEPVVVRNNETTWDELSSRRFDNIVISPGPGRPDRFADFGICKDAIETASVPLLGICLGHQGLAIASGASLDRVPSLVHGRTSKIVHHGLGLFATMPSPFEVARYHSFVIQRPIPSSLEETAWTEDGLVMGVARRDRPQWGVQFHPESILTEFGHLLLRNFRDLSFKASRGRSAQTFPKKFETHAAVPTIQTKQTNKAFWHEIPYAIDIEATFCSLFADQPAAFWLDSNLTESQLSRWSYLGDASGPLAATIEYRSIDRMVEINDVEGQRIENISIFEYLQRERRSVPRTPAPCPFVGGYVGWFGYELRNECGSPTERRATTPDALLIYSDRFIAVDHVEGKTFVCAIDKPNEKARAECWIHSILKRIDDLSSSSEAAELQQVKQEPISFSMRDGKISYLSKVERCLGLIANGETYQICLTNELSCEAAVKPLALYRTMRRINPAPFAAFIKWAGGAVLSASPERFLSADAQGHVEAKPIKGTMRRDTDLHRDKELAELLRRSRKDRAENAMIVDLLRNDLSRCCNPGTVSVPILCGIETYSTVHQLVSTVRGVLASGRTILDLLWWAFPGGSMTGAPKTRTMEHIDQLEQRARGVYSGALGWLGDDGAADLSIVIRSIVAAEGRFSIGAGGGVVAESTPEGEFEEMLLKAEASIKSIVVATFGSFDPCHYRLIDPNNEADVSKLTIRTRSSDQMTAT